MKPIESKVVDYYPSSGYHSISIQLTEIVIETMLIIQPIINSRIEIYKSQIRMTDNFDTESF